MYWSGTAAALAVHGEPRGLELRDLAGDQLAEIFPALLTQAVDSAACGSTERQAAPEGRANAVRTPP
jgi:hypothetical protein